MARLNIDIGVLGNPATGDTLRTAMSKINENFIEVYDDLAGASLGGLFTNNATNGDVKIQPNGTGIVEVDQLQINGDNITSLITNGDLTLSGNGTGGVEVLGALTATSLTTNTITSNGSNADLSIQASGTGNIDIAALSFNGTSITSSDSSRINLNENVTVDGDLLVTGTITGTISAVDADSSTVSNLEVDNFKAATIVTEAEGISSNDNNTTIPTSAAVKDYVDNNASPANVGDLSFNGSTISAPSNADLTLTTSGTGSVSVEAIQIKGTELSSTDSSQITIKENLHVTGNITGTYTGTISTLDADSTTVSNMEVDNFKASAIVTEAEGIASNDNDTTLPTSAAVKDYVDNNAGGSTGDLTITGSTISAPSNADLTLTTSGTGSVSIDGIQISGTELSSTDSTQVTIKENLHVTGNITGTLTASGNDTEVQFNNSGAFAGDSGLTFDSSGGKTLKVGAGGGTVKANSFQGADSVSTGVTFQSDNGSGVKANHLQIQSHTGSVQTVFPSGAVDFTSAGSVDFTGTTVTGLALTMVGDDSSGTAVNTGETFKFAGATGVTTAVSGDTLTITGPDLSSYITASSSDTLTNKTFDVEGTGNSISNIDVADFKAAAIVTEAEGIGSNDNDTTLPTSAAVKDYVDTEVSGVSGASTGDITFTGSTIQSPSNADITLDPSGTGGVVAQGPVTFNAGYIEKINSLTSSSTITVNCALASIHTVTLATNTEFNITNLPTGGTVTLIITQDGTGNRTATFGTDASTAVKFQGAVSTLSTIGGRIDVVTIVNDGTNFLGNIAKNYA